MLTIEKIVAAHLVVRTVEEWDKIAADVKCGLGEDDPCFDSNQLAEQLHNDEYFAVSEKLGIDKVRHGSAIARIGGNDVFASEGEAEGWAVRDFYGVMESYRHALMYSEDHPEDYQPIGVSDAIAMHQQTVNPR